MKRISLVIALALVAGAAQAQSSSWQERQTRTSICVDVNGGIIPVVCTGEASLVKPREDICQCPVGGMRTDVSICAPGERPPAESKEFEKARRVAALDGTLMEDTWQGQRMCVRPHND
ncbi:MAG TPA: hypothetical protein VIO94_17715 [Phenylobacterium sp.]